MQICLINVVRNDFGKDYTIGDLYINGEIIGHSLEDAVRPDGIKVYGETAIPDGVYEVELTHSNKFGRVLPLIKGVPGFKGIRIHGGNRPSQTLGCILVGKNKGAGLIWDSLEDKVIEHIRKFNECYISIGAFHKP